MVRTFGWVTFLCRCLKLLTLRSPIDWQLPKRRSDEGLGKLFTTPPVSTASVLAKARKPSTSDYSRFASAMRNRASQTPGHLGAEGRRIGIHVGREAHRISMLFPGPCLRCGARNYGLSAALPSDPVSTGPVIRAAFAVRALASSVM
jgi:hypothetical protein